MRWSYMEIVRMLSGPLIGAIIGYCTNLIAVKMLFYPREEICLFGHRLPFTPGVIPKGRPRLAVSVGNAVETYLLAKEDIEEKLLSGDVEDRIADVVVERLSGKIGKELRQLASMDMQTYRREKAKLSRMAGEQVIAEIQSADLTGVILDEMGTALKEKAQDSAWKLLINDKTVDSFRRPTKEQLDKIIEEHGAEYVTPIIEKKLTEWGCKTGIDILSQLQMDEQAVRDIVSHTYRKVIRQHGEDALKSLRISRLVENKINAMSIDELERLVQDVMKKELNAIINLGALIGFVLGLLNLVI